MYVRSPLLFLLLAAPLGLEAQQPADAVAFDSLNPPPALVDSACLHPYPDYLLRQARIEGSFRLRFVVDTTGAVDSATVRTAGGTRRELWGAARRDILRCRYRPARVAGRAVRAWMIETLVYRMPTTRLVPPPP